MQKLSGLFLMGFLIGKGVFAYAGAESSGGTWSYCGKTVVGHRIEMNELRGYQNFQDIILKLETKLPLLARQLQKVQGYDWYYFETDKCGKKVKYKKNKEAGLYPDLPIQADQPIQMNYDKREIYVLAPEFRKLKDPSTSLVNEAFRRICEKTMSDPDNINTCVWHSTHALLKTIDQSANDIRSAILIGGGNSIRPGAERLGLTREEYEQLTVTYHLKHKAAVSELYQEVKKACESVKEKTCDNVYFSNSELTKITCSTRKVWTGSYQFDAQFFPEVDRKLEKIKTIKKYPNGDNSFAHWYYYWYYNEFWLPLPQDSCDEYLEKIDTYSRKLAEPQWNSGEALRKFTTRYFDYIDSL